VKAKVKKKLTATMRGNGKMLPLPLFEQATSDGPPLLRGVAGRVLPMIHG
jgi:hypothetical protein